MTIIVTGAAGFIGFHTSLALLNRGEKVLGIDNLNNYYSVALKQARLARLSERPGFRFACIDIADPAALGDAIGNTAEVRGIVHLAAQAGVRYSLVNPYAYVHSNIMGHVAMMEAALRCPNLQHFVYASSSSVYGANREMPFTLDQPVERPISLYAATKRADELMTYSYCHTRGLTATGLRFFTVYGPWGRPDMAAFLFADAVIADQPIPVFNHGRMQRDFTFIDDIVAGVLAALDRSARPDQMGVCHALYNLGSDRPENLMDFIHILANALGRTPRFELLPLQPGDAASTHADIEASRRDLGFNPTTPISVGVPRFVDWYLSYRR